MGDADERRGKPAGPGKAGRRRERLAAAMRENLKRRKAQQRGRAQPEPAAEPVEEE
ncbi:MAG: hypothetical protein AB7I59_05225 [Geminicoccaceae bacterium]